MNVLLTNQIANRSDVQALSDNYLSVMESKHDEEIVFVQHRISKLGEDAPHSLKTALKFLRLHRKWIIEEKKARKKERGAQAEREKAVVEEIKRQQKLAAIEAHARIVKEAAEAKAARMASLQALDRKQITVFKTVVREVLGDEMYMHLWKMTQDRLLETA